MNLHAFLNPVKCAWKVQELNNKILNDVTERLDCFSPHHFVLL